MITEANKRLEVSLAESRKMARETNRIHEANMAESRLWMKQLGYKVEQIFERENWRLRQHKDNSGPFDSQEGEGRVDRPRRKEIVIKANLAIKLKTHAAVALINLAIIINNITINHGILHSMLKRVTFKG